MHHLNLLAIVAAGHGDHRRADELGATDEAETGVEHPGLEGDLNHRIGGHAGHAHNARGKLSPVLQVVARVGRDGRPLREARGGVHAHDLTQRHSEEAVGVALSEVISSDQRHTCEVAEGAHTIGYAVDIGEALAIEGHVAHGAVERHLQALELKLQELLARHSLDLRLPHSLSLHDLPLTPGRGARYSQISP
ncbi:MAG TPA: hypothetical protein DEP45_02270 [Armatimonadetes bacterium]|nr:hypothetical protein [Armatimonadota bacterium]